MGVIITREDIMAYAEVDYIIHHMNMRYLEMLPKKLIVFFDKMKDPEYEVFVDPKKPLQSQGLKKYTLEIIALLHLKYWCEDEERKKELYNRMETNQIKFEEQLREKFSTDNIFDNKEEKVQEEDLSKPKKINTVQVTPMTPKDEKEEDNNIENKDIIKKEKVSFISKIIKKVKEMFNFENKNA